MSKKQILLISSYSQGGIASVVDTFLNSDLKKIVDFIPSYKEAPSWVNWLKFPFFYIKFITILIFNRSIKIVHLLSADKGSFIRKSILLLTAKLFMKKAVFNLHSGPKMLLYKDDFFLIKFFISFILNQADLILVLSKQWQELIQKKCSNKNIKILYNPVNIKEKQYQDSNNTNVLFMGRMGKRKGAYDLVEAAKNLIDTNIKIKMYGDGEVEQIKDLVRNYSLENTVNVMGWITGSDVEQAYKDADIFILPSYDEGLPMSILEAMSYGLPIISTPVGGIPEQVKEGVNGFLIEPGDVNLMSEKLRQLAENKELQYKFGNESHNIAKEKFNVSVIKDELINHYESLINSK